MEIKNQPCPKATEHQVPNTSLLRARTGGDTVTGAVSQIPQIFWALTTFFSFEQGEANSETR